MIKDIKNALANLPERPWFVGIDEAEDCPDHKHSGLALVDTGRSEEWPIARLCEWQTAEFIAASPKRLTALVEYYEAAEELLNWRLKQFGYEPKNIQAARKKLEGE